MKKVSQKELMRAAFQYQDAFVSYAYVLVRDWALAEDAVQEAYLILMEKWEDYNPEYGVFSWAKKMVYFKVQELLRSRTKEVFVEDEELYGLVKETLEEHLNEETVQKQKNMTKALEYCMDRLNKTAVDLLGKYYWDCEPCEQIAAAMNRSINAVWLSLSRIRKKLRACMNRRLANKEAVS